MIYFIDAMQSKSKKIFLLLIIISYFIPYSINDSSFKLTKEIVLSIFTNNNKIINTNIAQKPKYLPKKEQIIIVIGESGRYANLSIFGYQRPTTPNLEKIKDKLKYKIIYANATNTDVVLPLFFNGANEPQSLDISNNIFTLAKNSNFYTTFITTQTDTYLKHITAYMQKNNINDMQILGTKNDLDLIPKLNSFDLSKKNLIVLQMMGQHSPYDNYAKWFNKFGDKSIKDKYDNTILQGDFVLSEIFKFGIKNNISIVYFSDHGELLGSGGYYGHNKFKEDVYKVPLISYLFDSDDIASQHDIYNKLLYYLGYKESFLPTNPIKINGSMISGEDGFIEIKQLF